MEERTCLACESTKIVARGMCSKHYQRWYKAQPIDLPDVLSCPSCLVEFKPHRMLQKYCTPECRNNRNSRRSQGYIDPVLRIRSCEYCGSEFRRAGRRVKYCSDGCAKVVRSIRSHARDYGVTREQYKAMLDAQGGKCRICGGDETMPRKTVLSVDHDHVSGVVRGLLCSQCNVGLGHFGDDPERLRAAAAYIERYRGVTA